MTQPKPYLAPDKPLQGIGMILLAFGIYTLQDTGVKFCGAKYPLPETVLFLCLGAFVAVLLVGHFFQSREQREEKNTGWGGMVRQLRRGWKPMMLYALLGTTGSIATFYVYLQMPLANAYAIAFARPLTVAVLAHVLLKEKLRPDLALAIAIGFGGILLMLPLKAGGSLLGAGLAVFAMLCSSLNVIVLRHARHLTAKHMTLVLYSALITTNAILASRDFVMPGWHDLLLNIGAGIAGGIATLMTVRALHMAPAAIVSPFHYSQLFWGILAGWLVFNTTPDGQLFLGAPIVIASGLYIGLIKHWRGTRRSRLDLAAAARAPALAAGGQG